MFHISCLIVGMIAVERARCWWRRQLRHCATIRKVVRFPMVSLAFFIDIKSFRLHCGPGVDSASNRNEYQKCSQRGTKVAGAQSWHSYFLHMSNVLKSGSVNFLETTGLDQACTVISLPLPFMVAVNEVYSQTPCTYRSRFRLVTLRHRVVHRLLHGTFSK